MSVKHVSPLNEFLKTFFCTRSLWKAFIGFWALTFVVFGIGLICHRLMAENAFLVGLPLSAALPFAYVKFKQRNGVQPDTEHKIIIRSGTVPQRFGVFFFLVVFLGPLGWGPAMLFLFQIYFPGADLNHYISPFLQIAFSSLFSATFAALLQIEEFPEPRKTNYKGMIYISLFVLWIVVGISSALRTGPQPGDIVYSPALLNAIDQQAHK